MLNSPWVKAVIPIRPGKEKAAIAWLRQAHVEGDDGLGAEYAASEDDPPELQSTPGHPVTVQRQTLAEGQKAERRAFRAVRQDAQVPHGSSTLDRRSYVSQHVPRPHTGTSAG